MNHPSRQHEGMHESSPLISEASRALQPLFDDLATESPALSGVTYFAVDNRYKNNANVVASAQPLSNTAEFFHQHLDNHRIDLGITALGTALIQKQPKMLVSRLNPEKHVTWATPNRIDNRIVGGAQAAFERGSIRDIPVETIATIWQSHASTVQEIAGTFHDLSKDVDSLGDSLELLPPTTPNAFVLSWDINNSTRHSVDDYAALRNFITKKKAQFFSATSPFGSDEKDYHNKGDGQDVALWLPDSVDRTDKDSIAQFLYDKIIPAMEDFINAGLDGETPPSAENLSVRVVLGLGYVQKDIFDDRVSQEYWNISEVDQRKLSVGFTDAVRRLMNHG